MRNAGTSPASATEVLAIFLKLGLTSFGGPIAHLGYFHRELITKRRWVSEAQYAQLIALCQFLPGPASSQLGFALGLVRAGWRGALAAFIGFTLPSALLLFAFAQMLPAFGGPLGQAVLHGLKLLAVAVVAQGVLTMAKRLTPDGPRALIAAATAALVITTASAAVQILTVAASALLGLIICRHAVALPAATPPLHYGTRTGIALLVLFAAVLLLAVALQDAALPLIGAATAFYRAGAWVFGGGHVVLPLLEQAVVAPGWVNSGDFLAGYGAAQAVPGPMFSLAAFLGARLGSGAGGTLGAGTGTLAIFLPGFLLTAGVLPLWHKVQAHPRALGALAGINASVVGLLAAALYDPVWTGAVFAPSDFAIALIAFALLNATRLAVPWVLTACVLASLARALLA